MFDLAIEDPDAALREIDKYFAEESLRAFIRLMWPIVEPERQMVEGWPLDAICEHLEAVTDGTITRLLMNVCPGFMKSLVSDVFWPAWEWGPKNRPSLRYMCASYSGDLTRRDNLRFRRVITSDIYQRLWGDRFSPSAEQFNIIRVANNKTGWKLATSVGGVGTGERADRVIIDDGNNPLESESPAVMLSTETWFTEVIPDRLNNLEESAIINIQQRTNEGDISGIILAKELEYVHLMVPMEYDPGRHCVTTIGWEDPRGLDEDGGPLSDIEREQRAGELAWPTRFSRSALTELYKAKGPYAVAGQYQQQPTPRGGGTFQREWLEPWPPLGPDGKLMEGYVKNGRIQYPAFEYVVAWVDTAFTEKQENDFCALTVMGVFRAEGKGRIDKRADGTYVRVADDYGYPKVMIMYGWQKRLTIHGPPQTLPPGVDEREWNSPRYLAERQKSWGLVEWVVDTCKRYKVDHLGIETQAAGHTLEQELERLHNDNVWSVELVPAKGDKVSRAYAVQGLISGRQVHVPMFEDGTYPTWCTPIIDQLLIFPKGKHDDSVDTITGGLRHIRDIGIFERREEFDKGEERAQSWQRNRPAQLPYDV